MKVSRHFLLAISIGIATLMEVLDIAVTNVSIPTIAGDLGVTPADGTWVISAYSIGNAIMLLLSGWVSKSVGTVRLFLCTIFMFVFASFMCGSAQSFDNLIMFRVFQGCVAGPLMPMSHTLLFTNMPKDKKDGAFAMWAAIVGLGPILGPTLGGFITDTLGWRWIFYLNIPVGITSFCLVFWLLRDQITELKPLKMDWVGLAFLIAGVASLQIALDRGNDLNWFQSHTVSILFISAAINITAFVIWTLHSSDPLVDVRLLTYRNYTLALFSMFLAYVAIFSGLIVYPLWLETQMGYTAIWAGFAMSPTVVGMALCAPFISWAAKRLDPRAVATIGFVLFAFSSYLSSTYNQTASFESLLIPRIVGGMGSGFALLGGMKIAMANIDKELLPKATSLFNFHRILGISIGSSLGVAYVEHERKGLFDQLMKYINAGNTEYNLMAKILKGIGFSQEQSLKWFSNEVASQAYMIAVNKFFLLGVVLFLSLVVMVWLAKPPFNQKEAHEV